MKFFFSAFNTFLVGFKVGDELVSYLHMLGLL